MYDKDENIYDFRPYRAAYNPEFLRKAKQRRAEQERAQRIADEKEASRLKEERRKLAMEASRKNNNEQHALEMKQVNALLEKYRALNIIDPPRPERPDAKSIIYKVATVHHVTIGDILGQRRDQFTVKARFAAIRAVSDARPDLTLPQIGKIFKRDHTSIIHALRATAKPGQHHRAAA